MGKGKKGGKRMNKAQLTEKLHDFFASQPGVTLSFKEIFRALHLDTHPLKMLAIDIMEEMAWGFTPDYFEYSEAYFKEFLCDPKNMENLKAEFFIPLMVNKLINDGTATVKVLDTTSKWFGVTYAADRPSVVARIQSLIDEGVYPSKLF